MFVLPDNINDSGKKKAEIRAAPIFPRVEKCFSIKSSQQVYESTVKI
jgi:hypothetical protein